MILVGEKEIANYCRISHRTLQRWKKIIKLPVNKPGGMYNHVEVDSRVVDAWKQLLSDLSARQAASKKK